MADLVEAAAAPHRRTDRTRPDRRGTRHERRRRHPLAGPAIGNLLDNALRHGTGTVRPTATVDGSRPRLRVTDEGPGFPPEFLPCAFDRFARAEASRTSEGSGLGLAFVHAVALAHGGTAHAQNAYHGSAVTLDLPC
ncbi:sensor histidine kinase [Streptomyces sp. NPDC058108]|uniref:sensor histidine kinase n=1 Tax=Streptomyces sp. NPDC058108 TaxID=3346344 RepID=UPI0036E1BD2E